MAAPIVPSVDASGELLHLSRRWLHEAATRHRAARRVHDDHDPTMEERRASEEAIHQVTSIARSRSLRLRQATATRTAVGHRHEVSSGVAVTSMPTGAVAALLLRPLLGVGSCFHCASAADMPTLLGWLLLQATGSTSTARRPSRSFSAILDTVATGGDEDDHDEMLLLPRGTVLEIAMQLDSPICARLCLASGFASLCLALWRLQTIDHHPTATSWRRGWHRCFLPLSAGLPFVAWDHRDADHDASGGEESAAPLPVASMVDALGWRHGLREAPYLRRLLCACGAAAIGRPRCAAGRLAGDAAVSSDGMPRLIADALEEEEATASSGVGDATPTMANFVASLLRASSANHAPVGDVLVAAACLSELCWRVKDSSISGGGRIPSAAAVSRSHYLDAASVARLAEKLMSEARTRDPWSSRLLASLVMTCPDASSSSTSASSLSYRRASRDDEHHHHNGPSTPIDIDVVEWTRMDSETFAVLSAEDDAVGRADDVLPTTADGEKVLDNQITRRSASPTGNDALDRLFAAVDQHARLTERETETTTTAARYKKSEGGLPLRSRKSNGSNIENDNGWHPTVGGGDRLRSTPSSVAMDPIAALAVRLGSFIEHRRRPPRRGGGGGHVAAAAATSARSSKRATDHGASGGGLFAAVERLLVDPADGAPLVCRSGGDTLPRRGGVDVAGGAPRRATSVRSTLPASSRRGDDATVGGPKSLRRDGALRALATCCLPHCLATHPRNHRPNDALPSTASPAWFNLRSVAPNNVRQPHASSPIEVAMSEWLPGTVKVIAEVVPPPPPPSGETTTEVPARHDALSLGVVLSHPEDAAHHLLGALALLWRMPTTRRGPTKESVRSAASTEENASTSEEGLSNRQKGHHRQRHEEDDNGAATDPDVCYIVLRLWQGSHRGGGPSSAAATVVVFGRESGWTVHSSPPSLPNDADDGYEGEEEALSGVRSCSTAAGETCAFVPLYWPPSSSLTSSSWPHSVARPRSEDVRGEGPFLGWGRVDGFDEDAAQGAGAIDAIVVHRWRATESDDRHLLADTPRVLLRWPQDEGAADGCVVMHGYTT